jgi:hypothetical protein
MNKLKNKKENSPPPYFSCGNRRLYIIHTRLRHNCTLNKDFNCFAIKLSIACGKIEDDYHYFFTCPKYKMPEIFYLMVYLKFTNCTLLIHMFFFGATHCLNTCTFVHCRSSLYQT